MSALARYGVVATLAFLVGGYLAWDHQAGNISNINAAHATLERDRAEVARKADADQRVIEFSRMEATNNAFEKYRTALASADLALRDRSAALTGVRNALTAADTRRGQASVDPRARTGADDPATLRRVVGECTAEYGKMAANAVAAGITVTALQDWAAAARSNSRSQRQGPRLFDP